MFFAVEETEEAFLKLVPDSETLPPLPLTNANLVRYQDIKKKFEDVRHAIEQDALNTRNGAAHKVDLADVAAVIDEKKKKHRE